MNIHRNRISRLLIAVALTLALAGGGRVLAATTTNYWTNAVGTASWNTGGNWNPSTVPAATDAFVYFTNNAASAYTVQFTAASTSGAFHVTSDKIVLDLNGYKYYGQIVGSVGAAIEGSHIWSGNAGETSTVTISSSAAPALSGGNSFDMGSAQGYWDYWRLGGGSTLNIDKSLSTNAVVVKAPGQFFSGGTMTIDGQTLQGPSAGGNIGLNGTITVKNGGTLDALDASTIGSYYYSDRGYVTVTSNSTLKTATSMTLGFGGTGNVKILTNSTWAVGTDLTVGSTVVFFSYDDRQGDALVDNSSLYAGTVTVGDGSTGNGRLIIRNGSTAVVSNGYVMVNTANYTYPYHGALAYNTNELVLANSTLKLGNNTHNGAITNRGILRASGTITGQGPGNFLLRNELRLDVGNSPGVLTLNKGNVELAAGSRNYFQFSDTALSQINAHNGYASLLGSNIFSLAAGAPSPVAGVKYGLGVYDFVIATNITKSTQYDNLVNLLTNTYHLTYGVDFQYGVVNLGGGLFALELSFVPEPSTVMLLALGGLLVWRRVAKNNRK